MTIVIQSAYASDPHSGLAGARVIELANGNPQQGGFGAVYRVLTIDGKSTRPMVAKLLIDNGFNSAAKGFETVRELQRRAADADLLGRAAGRGAVVDQYPSLCALPLLSFQGTLQGRPVMGYLAIDLTAHGFKDLAEILDDEKDLISLQLLPLTERLAMVKQLIDCFEFLASKLQFIHADIKADALFVNIAAATCAVIDFDSGALARDASDKPSTFGTRQDWLAPEILKQLTEQATGCGTISVDVLSDIWSVNIAVHYLLFGCHPLFFLSEVSERSMTAYTSNYVWPDVHPSFPFFRKDYAALYKQYTEVLRTTLPVEIVKSLRCTLTEGFADPSRRSSYSLWQSAFRRLLQPGIQFFQADRLVVRDRQPIRLSWSAFGAQRLELTMIGDVTERTSVDVAVHQDASFTLRSVSWRGEISERTLLVTVDKTPPVIHSFGADTRLVVTLAPVHLTWSTSGAERITINGIDVTGKSRYDVVVRSTTVFRLVAESFCGVRASTELTIPVTEVPPTISSFFANRSVLVDDEDVSLSWVASDNAHEVELVGVGPMPRAGTIVLCPAADSTYIIRATSCFGAVAEKRLPIKVSRKPPSIRRFALQSLFLQDPTSVRLDWEVVGATRVRIEPHIGLVSASGTRTVNLSGVTSLELLAESRFGVVSSRTLVIRRSHGYRRTTSLQQRPALKPHTLSVLQKQSRELDHAQ